MHYKAMQYNALFFKGEIMIALTDWQKEMNTNIKIFQWNHGFTVVYLHLSMFAFVKALDVFFNDI